MKHKTLSIGAGLLLLLIVALAFTLNSGEVQAAQPGYVTVTVNHHYEGVATPVQETLSIQAGAYTLGNLFRAAPDEGGSKVYEIDPAAGGSGEVVNFREGYEYTIHIYYRQLFTVTFMTNDGTDAVHAAREVISSFPLGVNMPAAPVRSGFTFNGWNTAANGSGAAFSDTTVVESNVTVFAQWGQSGGGNPNGGGGGGQPDVGIPEDDIPLNPFITEHVSYIVGYPGGAIRPEQSITRAEVATIFFRLLTEEVRGNYWIRSNPFPDVDQGMWHNNAVSTMYQMGILRGYPGGAFNPDSPISRAELATISARFARVMGMLAISDVSFGDIEGHWAVADIAYAGSIGWVTGYPDGSFLPDRNITRAETVSLVNRMMTRVPETADDLLGDEMIKWVDNADPSSWYYLAVQEATNSHIPEFKDTPVPSARFNYEYWLEMAENPDWSQFE